MRNMRIVTFLVASLAVAGCNDQPKKAESAPTPAVATQLSIGRYVIVHSPQVERDTILLDTMTGKTWQQVEFSDLQDGPSGWDPMPHTDSDEDMNALRAAHPPKGKKSTPTVDDLLGPDPGKAAKATSDLKPGDTVPSGPDSGQKGYVPDWAPGPQNSN